MNHNHQPPYPSASYGDWLMVGLVEREIRVLTPLALFMSYCLGLSSFSYQAALFIATVVD